MQILLMKSFNMPEVSPDFKVSPHKKKLYYSGVFDLLIRFSVS